MMIIVLSCNKDDEITKQNPSTNLKTAYRLLIGDDLKNALKIYEEQITQIKSKNEFTKSEENFTIDETEVLENTDRTGKIHYIYRVNHPLNSESVFFNLVISDNDGYKKTRLIKYEMTTEFAERFNSGESDFINMDGIITFSLLNADEGNPCGETPINGIPIQGGSGPGGGGSGGSGSGGGGGEPWDPNGNGNPHNQALVDAQYLSMTLNYFNSQGGTGEDGEDEMEPGGTDDDGWYLVSRSPRSFNVPPLDDTLNPCGEEEEVGVLLPWNLVKLPYHINFSQELQTNFSCQVDIMQEAINNCSEISGDFLNIFQGSDNYHITYNNNNSDMDPSVGAFTHIESNYSTENGQQIEIEITFNNSSLNNSTDLSLVCNVMHENIHSILLFLKYTHTIPIMDDNPTYTQLLNAYIETLIDSGTIPDTNEAHHDFMTHFVTMIAEGIKNYGISKGYNHPDNFYNALAWSGLQETDTFNQLYPEFDSQGNSNPDFIYTVGTILTEYYNDTFVDSNNNPLTDQNGNPILPQGNTCND